MTEKIKKFEHIKDCPLNLRLQCGGYQRKMSGALVAHTKGFYIKAGFDWRK